MSILKPWNRRVLLDIIPNEVDDHQSTGILVPEDYKPKRNDHVLARVLSVAADASQTLSGKRVVVQPNGLEEFLDTEGETHTVALENYIVAVLED
tara:strand:+ start:50 stop:334 length:285 start_codon:yes stop_codon:yes gene_type:complete